MNNAWKPAPAFSQLYDAHPKRFTASQPMPPTQPTEVWINPPAGTQEVRR